MVRHFISRKLKQALATASLAGVVVMAVGCEGIEEPKSFFDPAQVGRLKSEPLVVPILPKLTQGADEEDAQFVGARDIIESDLSATAVDYTISPNDTLSVQISDLVAPGAVTERTIRVTQTGKISLQLLPQPIKVEGMTEQQVERAIADAYRDAQVIQNAQVAVAVIEARGRTYTVSGAVGAEGLYAIYDTDFRLLDALVAARGVSRPLGTDTIYIVRKKKSDVSGEAPAAAPAPVAPTPGKDPLAPQSNSNHLPLPRRSVMLQDGQAPAGAIVTVDGKEVVVTPPAAATQNAEAVATTEPVKAGAFEFNALKEPDDRVVIKVPYQQLKSGQLKYNVVIRPGDLIYVPQAATGVYYVHGNVSSAGAYSLTDSKITLTQAIAAARGLNDVAWPSRTEIVRRLPGDKQVFVRVDLDKIFAGEQPDLYLKADDRVNVGTHVIAPFLAAFRNGFRVSYGFGWLYDRNYASGDNGNNN